jgi:hypothetical protein
MTVKGIDITQPVEPFTPQRVLKLTIELLSAQPFMILRVIKIVLFRKPFEYPPTPL